MFTLFSCNLQDPETIFTPIKVNNYKITPFNKCSGRSVAKIIFTEEISGPPNKAVYHKGVKKTLNFKTSLYFGCARA